MSAQVAAPYCTVCSQPVSGRYFETEQGVAYHATCFVCVLCQQEIGASPFVKRDVGFVCSACAEKTRPTRPATTTTTTTTTNTTTTRGPGEEPRGGGQEFSSSSSSSSGSYPTCGRCNDPILTPIYRENEGKCYHTDCFRCDLCNGLAGKTPVYQNGKQYCQDCSQKGFLDTCFKCKQPLNGGYRVALDQKYHKECFVCWGCGCGFDDGAFYESDGVPHCKSCAEAKLNQPRS